MQSSAGPKSRSRAVDRLSSGRFDLLVIGGGITGAGIALDAATRGLSVALVEKGDFASGTSSKSSKLIHGGLRYLQHRDFGLVREAARERDLLRRLAPHLVTHLPFVWPRWAGAGAEAGVGLWAYDVLAGFRNFGRHRRVDSVEVSSLVPGQKKSSGGYLFYDAQTDDVRLTLAVLEAARRAGAVISNYVRGEEFLEASGRVAGCLTRDMLADEPIEIRAAEIVNATGVWADHLRLIEAEYSAGRLRPSKGIHVLLSRASLPLEAACLIPTRDRSLIFVLPWRSSVLVGTTDTEYSGPLDSPSIERDEVDYLLAALSGAFERDFGPVDVVGAYAGLRPLLAGARSERTRDLSRRHAIMIGPRGVITITGGKLTTYRRMARDVVDIVARRRGKFRRSFTASIRLGVNDTLALHAEVSQLASELSLDDRVASSLIGSYGDRALDVLRLARDMDLAAPLVQGLPYLVAEAVFAVREEMAMKIEDILARRTRVSIEDPGGGIEEASILAGLLAEELSLRPEEITSGIGEYAKALALERGPALSGAITRGEAPTGT